MKVNEYFISIQGEGPHSGRRALFIRFSGCNLKCGFCDSKYASHIYTDIPFGELCEMIHRTGIKYVVLTGGEPTIQVGFTNLLNWLDDNVYTVDVETNGTRLPDEKNRDYVTYIVSPKDKVTAKKWLQFAIDTPCRKTDWVFKFVVDVSTIGTLFPWIKKYCYEPVWLMPLTTNARAQPDCMIKEMIAMGNIVSSEMIKYGIDGYLCTRLQNLYRVR